MKSLAILIFFLGVTNAKYRICAPESVTDSTCNSLSRGDSQVSCVRVTDSADCAIKISENEADFGVFNAEELLLAYQCYPDNLQPIVQLRHEDKMKEDFEFQTVAVVPASFNENEGLEGLRNGGLCHPGFSEAQIWNDYILKFFEKKVYGLQCNETLSVGENDALNIKNFFGKACRPGDWVSDKSYDNELKKKYPELCELCDNKSSCKYANSQHQGHMGALDCLTSGRGKAAYVAYHYVQQHFNLNLSDPDATSTASRFRFLCKNGSLQPLTKKNPCGWIHQPWSAILSRQDQAFELSSNLRSWLVDSDGDRSESWTVSLRLIVLSTNRRVVNFSTQTSFRTYLVTGREVDVLKESCGKTIRWCTVNEIETKKCNWVAKESQLLGIEPAFSCHMMESTFDCLQNISANEADIITIDSNYGYLARNIYNLSTILYTETDKDKNSAVIAVVREGSPTVHSFSDLKDKVVCLPDYGGVAWLSFINTLEAHKMITHPCDYHKDVSNVLSGACVPGINHASRSDVKDSAVISQLCSACQIERSNSTCSADHMNPFYGDNGALKCLLGPGDIAFIEAKNVRSHIRGRLIKSSDYRVLCRNGSFAEYTGFDVDENCALSVTIDSEVVGRNETLNTLDTTIALLKIEDWLGYRAYSRRAIRIYDSFDGYEDLLFKDSTIGLESINSEVKSILAYKELFRVVESCKSAAAMIFSSISIIFVSVIALIM